MPSPSGDRFERAAVSLEGLSVGDAFGETFFVNPDVVEGLIAERALAPRTWHYTDDTLTALSVVSVLGRHGRVRCAWLRAREPLPIRRGRGPPGVNGCRRCPAVRRAAARSRRASRESPTGVPSAPARPLRAGTPPRPPGCRTSRPGGAGPAPPAPPPRP